jgi:hypothetical protein
MGVAKGQRTSEGDSEATYYTGAVWCPGGEFETKEPADIAVLATGAGTAQPQF